MGIGYPGMWEEKENEYKRDISNKELSDFWLHLNDYEKRALKQFVYKLGKQLELEEKKIKLEQLQEEVDSYGNIIPPEPKLPTKTVNEGFK